MEDVNVPVPNPFITEWLVGERCQAIVLAAAGIYQDLYQDIVAKRTGELAASARVSAGIEGDRWVGHMEVGSPIAYYAASHEFGTGEGDEGDAGVVPGAHDLNTILDLVATQ